MLSLAALVPSPPMLVPQLCGRPMRAELATEEPPTAVRAAALSAATALATSAREWVVVGVGDATASFPAETRGTFRGFGADVVVGLAPQAHSIAVVDAELPLPVLIAGWLREQVGPDVSVRAHVLAVDTPVADCVAFGAHLRAELDAIPEPQGVLVVADGAATLTEKAPGYFDSRAAAAQADLDDALRTGSRADLTALDPALCADLWLSGRAAYQALAGLFAVDAADPAVRTLYQGAPLGVAYDVSLWEAAR
ncbi:hypothetical protein [Nocardia camponoti]|uniref:hypothetical protein n=1 Tax=Nocardia camponoti TaxID=1616106 RepID=UPI00166355EF|nr:hypothetical protein [Nocardia camponoti]